MKKQTVILAALLVVWAIGGCSTMQKAQTIRLGMTKAEVLNILGPPTTLTIREGQPIEYLHYALPVGSRSGDIVPKTYSIAILNGRVNGHGAAASVGLSEPGY